MEQNELNDLIKDVKKPKKPKKSKGEKFKKAILDEVAKINDPEYAKSLKIEEEED